MLQTAPRGRDLRETETGLNAITRLAGVAVLSALLAGCNEAGEIEAQDPPPRPIKSFVVEQSASSVTHSFPSVIEPSQSSELSFEVGGQLMDFDLRVGEAVTAGQVLLSIDPRSLELERDRARSAVSQTEARLRNARGSFERQSELLEDGFTTRAAFDEAQTALESAQEDLDSARAQLSLAEENLSKADLVAPFDGTISRISVEAFDIVSPGTPVVAVYNSRDFELAFAVPATIINSVSVGDAAQVRIAQRTDLQLDGTLSELGSRSDGSNAYPATVLLSDPVAGLKSGMAAEVTLEVPVAGGADGFLVPVGAMAFNRFDEQPGDTAQDRRRGQVFKYDAATQTVKLQPVSVAGVRGNQIIITGGLAEGDRIASAGVSYLHDGQAVTLLEAR